VSSCSLVQARNHKAWGPFLTSPPGDNFTTRGQCHP
jgi:hypothetical protein